MKRGLFITFEGGEGAGKTTQIKKLAARIPDCVLTREPGGTPAGDALRSVFIDHQGQDWPPIALLLLMFSARVLHTEHLIKPALARGQTVLCDRYADSTFVYQGYAGGIPLQDIQTIKTLSIGTFEPDITFILDLDPVIGLKRTGKRDPSGHTFEAKDIAFHEKLRNGFLTIAKENPTRCVVVDATQDMDVIAEQIWNEVSKRL